MKAASPSISRLAALRDLTSSSTEARILAVEGLTQIAESGRDAASGAAPPDILQALRRSLADTSPDVRYAAALGLGTLGDRAAGEALARLVRDDREPWPRQAALVALGQLADPRHAPAIRQALQHGAADVRFQAVTALSLVDPAGCLQDLVRALDDDDDEVRAAALAAIGEVGVAGDATLHEVATPLLAPRQPWSVRIQAAVTLSRLGSSAGQAVLAESLADEDYGLVAAEQLYRAGVVAGAATDLLLSAATDRHTPIPAKLYAAATLLRANVQEASAKQVLLAAFTGKNDIGRGLAIQLLGELGEPWCKEALSQALAQVNTSAWRRWEAELAEALSASPANDRRDPPFAP